MTGEDALNVHRVQRRAQNSRLRVVAPPRARKYESICRCKPPPAGSPNDQCEGDLLDLKYQIKNSHLRQKAREFSVPIVNDPKKVDGLLYEEKSFNFCSVCDVNKIVSLEALRCSSSFLAALFV